MTQVAAWPRHKKICKKIKEINEIQVMQQNCAFSFGQNTSMKSRWGRRLYPWIKVSHIWRVGYVMYVSNVWHMWSKIISLCLQKTTQSHRRMSLCGACVAWGGYGACEMWRVMCYVWWVIGFMWNEVSFENIYISHLWLTFAMCIPTDQKIKSHMSARYWIYYSFFLETWR